MMVAGDGYLQRGFHLDWADMEEANQVMQVEIAAASGICLPATAIQETRVKAIIHLVVNCFIFKRKEDMELLTDINNQAFPAGKLISSRLSSNAVGHLLQVQEFVCRFQQVLGVNDRVSFEELEYELLCLGSPEEAATCGVEFGDKLTSVHRALLPELLKKLLGEKEASVVDQLTINELTWPEFLRSYLMAYLLVRAEVDSVDSMKLIHYLQGYSSLFCVSPTTVAGVNLDAQLLGKAVKRVFGNIKGERRFLSPGSKGESTSNGGFEEWAKVLDPVRKLPTNVGSRIRNCVKDALKLNPPQWAKEKLDYCISKEIYKGNASGPTKRAVIEVLNQASEEVGRQLPANMVEKNRNMFICDSIMKRCHFVLRNVAACDIKMVFCNLVGRNLSFDDTVFQSASRRPLDLRTIDLQLLHGAYGGQHEAFLEDVREMWINFRKIHRNKPTLVMLADDMSNKFELQYEKEVVGLIRNLREFNMNREFTAEVEKELQELVTCPEIPQAPWETGICKVCGINRDDKLVLLCDACNAEYHTYCLNPPLSDVPDGHWFCAACAPPPKKPLEGPVDSLRKLLDNASGEDTQLLEIAKALEETEYWDLEADKKAWLVKFLCEEASNVDCIRANVDLSKTEQLPKWFLRNEFLGVDSRGSFYWGFRKTSRHGGIVVNDRSDTYPSFDHSLIGECGTWSVFQSDEEIDKLVDYLRMNDPKKKELVNSMLEWKTSMLEDGEVKGARSLNSKSVSSCNGVATKASALLDAKYNIEAEATTESQKQQRRKSMGKWQRCKCLEPVFPSRYHCLKCHVTFFTNIEFQQHKNSCTCTLNSSALENNKRDVGNSPLVASGMDPNNVASVLQHGGGAADEFGSEYAWLRKIIGKEEGFCVPDSSYKRIVGRGGHVLRQLKMSLLDMEAAIPQGGRRASGATPQWRNAWCAFVKSANTIYQMVEAVMVLETMIKTEYINKRWWYHWSSVSTAVKTCTLSALALRIYTLDASIKYHKSSAACKKVNLKKQKGATAKSEEQSNTKAKESHENNG